MAESPFATLTWDPADDDCGVAARGAHESHALDQPGATPGPATIEAMHSVRRELGLTRNGRMRSVLRDSDLWRLTTAVVVAGRIDA